MKALTSSEFNSLLSATPSLRDRTMFYLAFRHGMRATEICSLLVKDVDFSKRTIRVRRLKGSMTNWQTLSEKEMELLLPWMEEREKSGDSASQYIFPTNRGSKMTRVQFWRLFRAAAERAGIPEEKRHPHVLKHTLGMRMVEAGMSPFVIKQAMGHRNLSSTSVYAEVTDEMANREMEKIDAE